MSDRKSRMYGKSPSLERGEDGNMSVKKHEAKEESAGAEGSIREDGDHEMRHSHERMAMHHRHVHEHLALHHKHEVEHHHHEGDKKVLHERHEKEYGEMHAKHHAEMKKLHKKHEEEIMKAGSMDGKKKEKEEGEGTHEKEMKSDEKGDKILKAATKE